VASLYEHIRANRLPKGSAGSPGLVLPDEPPDDPSPYGGPRIRWAAGARDGVAVFHLAGRAPGVRQIAPICDALITWLRTPTLASREALEATTVRMVGDEAFVPFIGPVLERFENVLDADHELANTPIAENTRRLLLETEQRDVLKLAIALLGAFGDESDRDTLETVGLHDEFTLYAVDAIGAIFADPFDVWMLFAVELTGWGKIHAVLSMVERLPDAGAREEEVRRYLLRWGCENGVLNGYLAEPIATAARLHDALEGSLDADLLEGAGIILSALAEGAAEGGPGGELGDYEQGAVATERYLKAMAAADAPGADRFDSFLAVASLRHFVRETIPTDRPRWEALGWTEPLCQSLLEIAAGFLDQPRWRDAALAALASTDATERWKARGVCRVLEVPMATELEFVVGADPSDVGAWHDLSQQADREGMERAATVAPGLLRLDKLFAGGPTTSLGFGPDFSRFEICDALANGLARFPGSGGSFLRQLLESPSVRNRHSGLRAYESWPQAGPRRSQSQSRPLPRAIPMDACASTPRS